MNKKHIAALCVLALLAVVPACGKSALKTESVVGVVTLDGSPLENATIKFTPVVEGQGDPAYARTDASGAYQLQTTLGKVGAGTTPGKYAVTIDCYEEVETGRMILNAEDQEVPETEERSLLPARYSNPEASGLEAEVVKGKNTFNFDLTSE
ncbi:MAG: carboxypeptidase regulatory-like domain-containing protein [Thermoguttaceae bacterium]|nr:carboxypeptidase regulatory-like domain-containing protein [Thermoguttaceae bacterium]